MGKQFADYVYSNPDDSVRIRIFKTINNEWDYDIVTKEGIKTFSEDAGDNFPTKKEAKADAETQYGKLTSNNLTNLVQGWF